MPSEPDQVVELLPDGIVWAVLRKYARSGPGAGSQLGAVGGGHRPFSQSARDTQATVGAKLARCPVVERALWLSEAELLIRNVLETAEAAGWEPSLSCEHPMTVDAAFEFATKGPKRRGRDTFWRFNAMACAVALRRLQRSQAYREQWTLLVCELSACWADEHGGSAFRGWIEEKA
jgi:hypothetical protein